MGKFQVAMGWCAVLLAAGLLLTLAGCQDERAAKVDRGFRVAQARYEDVNRNAMAALALASSLETGGDTFTYLIASLDENGDYPPFVRLKPSQPFCVVVRDGPGDSAVTLEGYYEDLAQPALSAVVQLRPAAGR